MDKFIVGIGGEREYIINGVRYTVTAKFLPHSEEKTLPFQIKRIIKNSAAHFTAPGNADILDTENVCPAAGKED